MTVAQYFEKTSSTVSELANASGVSEATIRNARNGVALSTFALGLRLEEATNGDITVADACDPHGSIRKEIEEDIAKRNAKSDAAAAA